MIVRFVSTALVIGGLLSLAAFATERLLRIWNRQARWVWPSARTESSTVVIATDG